MKYFKKEFHKKYFRKELFYFSLLFLVVCAVFEPHIPLKLHDGLIFVLILFLGQTFFEKNILLKELSFNSEMRQQVIDNLCKYCPDLITYKNLNLEYIMCNEAFLDFFGVRCEKNEIKGNTTYDFLPENLASKVIEHDKRVVKKGNIVKYNVECEDGKIIEVVSAPIVQEGKTVGILSIGRDVTEKEVLHRKLLASQDELETILDNLPIVAILKDPNGNFLRGNARLSQIMGEQKAGAVYNLPDDFYIYRFDAVVKKEDELIVKTKKPIKIEKKVSITKDLKKWYKLIKAPIFDENGDIKNIVVFARDIDIEKTSAEEKDSFVATLTHDLKTPTLAQIRILKLLLNGTFGSLKNEQRELLEQLLSSCNYMFNMILTILYTYRYEGGDIELNFTNFDFEELINSVCKEFEYLANEKKQKISINCSKENDFLFEGDKIQIRRVIVNLVSNAILYGERNSKIKIDFKKDEKNFNFSISSKSFYMDNEKREAIFKKFGSKSSYNKVSTGLGLYLSKKIVIKHGGEMFVESDKDGLNTFGFFVPSVKFTKTTETIEI